MAHLEEDGDAFAPAQHEVAVGGEAEPARLGRGRVGAAVHEAVLGRAEVAHQGVGPHLCRVAHDDALVRQQRLRTGTPAD